MPNYQKMIVEGHIAKDPQLLSSSGGKTYTKFSIPWENKGARGDKKETLWFQVLAFHDLAREVAETYHKGDAVHVEGMLSVSVYTDSQGNPKPSLTIMAQVIEDVSHGDYDGGSRGEEGDLPF